MDDPQDAQQLGPPITVTHVIRASAAVVWGAIAAPGYLERCHPFCAANPVVNWPGPSSMDEIHYLSGWVYERRFVSWFDGTGYDLEIGARGEPHSWVSWRVTPVEGGRSSLTISIRPHVLGGLPGVVRWLPYAVYVRPMLRRYLSSVVRGVEWFVTRNEAVRHNQFGRHPWFSARE